MEKTVNQWLDMIDQFDESLKKKPEIEHFKKFLLRLKVDEQYLNYGGLVKVALRPSLSKIFNKS